MRYIAENPDTTQLNEIIKKYVNLYNKKTNYIKFLVCEKF